MLQHNSTAAFPDPGYHANLSTLINMASYNHQSDLSSLVHTNGAHHPHPHHPQHHHHPSGEIFIQGSHHQHPHTLQHQPQQQQGQPQRHHSASSAAGLNLGGVYAGAPPGCCPSNGLATAAAASLPANMKDSRWLTLEVCRQFQRNQCSRSDTECKFAHPPAHVDVQNGRVTCCYDSIKGKCQRREPPCKYLHPPQHLREQLMVNGRNSMILRNMQLQLLHQQLLAQRGAAAVAAAVNLAAGSPSSLPTPNNSIIYSGGVPLSLTSTTAASGYPVLNFSYSPYLNALTTAGAAAGLAHPTGHEYLPAAPIPNEHVTRAGTGSSTLNGFSSSNGTTTSLLLGRVTKRLPLSELHSSYYYPPAPPVPVSTGSSPAHQVAGSNKAPTVVCPSTSTNTATTLKTDNELKVPGNPVGMVTGGTNCLYVMNGGASVETNNNNTGSGDLPLAGNAIYTTVPPVSTGAPQQQAMASLAAAAAVAAATAMNSSSHQSSMGTSYQAVGEQAATTGYFQPAYHMEIPSFSYQ